MTVPLQTTQLYRSRTALPGLSIARTWVWSLLLAVHGPLALAIHKAPLLATTHAYLTLFAVIVVAARRSQPATVLLMSFYLLGSEVLWRMCNAAIPWETGKYAVVLLCGLSSFRAPGARPLWPLLYFLLLIPSALGTLFDYPLNEAKRFLSFNLSGPLALSICLWFCTNRKLCVEDLPNLLRMALVPLVGVLSITLFSTYSQQLTFTTESNFAVSGGFGPNQVSALLGLGAVFCFCLLVVEKKINLLSRLILLGLLAAFLAQAMMTFSRTGVYLAGGFMLASSLVLLRTPRARIYLMMGAVIFGTIGSYIVFPKLNAYTGGKLAIRYAETHTTGRSDIMRAEIEMFLDNPILGVGPGGAKAERSVFAGFASHSEPSRMLAEHGIFGAMALLLLIWQMIKAVTRPKPLVAKACAFGAVVWVVGFFFASAMRLVAPVLVLVLVFVDWSDSSEKLPQ